MPKKPAKKPTKKVTKKKVTPKKAKKPINKIVVTKRTKKSIHKTVKKIVKHKKTAPKKAVIKEVWKPAEYKPKTKKSPSAGMGKRNKQWLEEMRQERLAKEAAAAAAMPRIKPNVIKSAAKVKLVRFRRETDTEYSARTGEAKQEAKLTSKGRKLSNKEIAYLMLHNSLSVYADIATLSEMQTAAGHKLRASRVVKIRNVLRKRAIKMLKYVRALLEKRGIIESSATQEPQEITDADTQAAAGNQVDPIQQAAPAS